MASDHNAAFKLQLEHETSWQPGDEVEGSLALSTPSFPSDESCKLEPSTIRGVPMAEQHSLPPRRKSDSLISPRTGENINKWFIGQRNAGLDYSHILDAEACAVEPTRANIVAPFPLALYPEAESPANSFMALNDSTVEDQVAIQADMIHDLRHNIEVQARDYSLKIGKLEEEKASLTKQLIVANERLRRVKQLESFSYGPEVDEKPMDFIHKKNNSFRETIHDLDNCLLEGDNAAAVYNQLPALLPILTQVHNKGGQLVGLVKNLASDCEVVDFILHASDSSMVQSSKKRYEKMEDSDIDQAIKNKFPGLTLD